MVLARTRAGAGQQDLLRFEVELARTQDELQRLLRSAAPLDARLASALAIDEVLFEVSALAPPTDWVPSSLDSNQLLETAPILATLQARVEAARAQRQLAAARRKPAFALGVDWLQVDSALSPNTPGSGDNPLAVSLSLDLPVWVKADDASERSASHVLRAAQLDLEQATRKLKAEVAAQLFAIEDAQRTRHLHRDVLVPRADETLSLLVSAYRAGEATLFELIETERLRLDLALAESRAGRDQRQAIARLRALVGATQ